MNPKKIAERLLIFTLMFCMILGNAFLLSPHAEALGERTVSAPSSMEEVRALPDATATTVDTDMGVNKTEESSTLPSNESSLDTASSEIDATGLIFNSLLVREAESGNLVADLLKGEIPTLKVDVTYALDVDYTVPSALQFENTYFTVNFGDGLYVKTLPGATFTEGAIENTGFEKLVKAPTGNGTAPYGYATLEPSKNKNGDVTYKTKGTLTNVSSKGEICFAIDEAYLNQDTNQILSDILKVSLSTDTKKDVDAHTFDVKSEQAFTYTFYVNQATEVLSKGGTTSTLNAVNVGNKSLTEENSKTTVEIVYPNDLEFISLEENRLYNKEGKVLSTSDDGTNKTSLVEWDEAGSYSGGLSFIPHIKVPQNSGRANGSSFNIILKNFKKTIYKDTPNADRTSLNGQAVMRVTIIDGNTPEKITTHALVDSAPNWALKKYDTYNVRLGALLIKNELPTATKAKTLELTIDEGNTAIIRGVTIPYHKDIQYGKIYWTSADGRQGEADADILKKSNVAGLITNTALGLGINDSIKSIKVELGALPPLYDGIKPMQDLLDTWNANNKYVYDEYYGWSYICCGVYGSWKQKTKEDVISYAKLYTSGTEAGVENTHKMVGKSAAPEILNGKGTIDKTQVMGGDSFKISGVIDDANWDWNPLQEPILYMIMPEGFIYKDLVLTEGTLSSPEYVGEFEKDGVKLKAWKYMVDIGQETRGQYQPDFSIKSMKVSFKVETDKKAKTGTYHINDFFGFTTKDFAEIGAVIKAEKWDRSNWNTQKYTATFGDAINSGKDMVSLSERTGVMVKQAYEITAQSELMIPKSGQSFIYDKSTEETKKLTTPVLSNDDKAILRITIRNNTTTEIDHATLFVPMLKENLDFGKAFMPEGKNQFPLNFEEAKTTENFEINYIKVKEGKTFEINTSLKKEDYDIVTDPSEANMIMLISKVALAPGDGGRIDINYKVDSDITSAYNNKVDVITPVLDYDINGNKSTLTKEPAAISFFTSDVYMDYKVVKEWVGLSKENAKKESVMVQLYKNGEPYGNSKKLDAENNFETIFVDLKETEEANGSPQKNVYTFKELDSSGKALEENEKILLNGKEYTIHYDGNKVVNTLINPQIEISGKKVWEDRENQDGIRPKEVIVHLLANGSDTGKNLKVTEATDWKYSFDSLDTYDANGDKILYSVSEDQVDGYQVKIEDTTITNTHQPEVFSIGVNKIWQGQEQDKAVIRLYADDKEVASQELSSATNWSYTFENLDKYKDGKEIQYEIREDKMEGYTTSITGDAASGFTVTNTKNEVPNPPGEVPNTPNPPGEVPNIPNPPKEVPNLPKEPSNPPKGPTEQKEKPNKTLSNKKSEKPNTQKYKKSGKVRKAPVTGDKTNLFIWFSLGGISIIGILVLLYVKRRK
ncbi:MAG TPA: Cna B-type domain-containing protein [Lachnospiraceae bacterium]